MNLDAQAHGPAAGRAIYSHPSLYDRAVDGFADDEFAACLELARPHARRPLERLVEPACGTGAYMRAAARAGFVVRGYDISGDMVDYANDRFAREGLGTPCQLGSLERPPRLECDVSLLLADALSYVETRYGLRGHFAGVSASLSDGGVALVEFLHLAPDAPLPRLVWGDGDMSCEWDVLRLDTPGGSYSSRLVLREGNEPLLEEEESTRLWGWEALVDAAAAAGLRAVALHDPDRAPVGAPATPGLHMGVFVSDPPGARCAGG